MYTDTDNLSKTLGGTEESMVSMEGEMGGGQRVIISGLLCNILKRMSGTPNKEEFIAVITTECDENDVFEAWTKLFTFFNDVDCPDQKKPVITINRHSSDKRVRDIVRQLTAMDKEDISRMFVMPWDYEMKPLETEVCKRAKLIAEQNTADVDVKLVTLQNKMEEKNKALVDLINLKFNEVIANVTASKSVQQNETYAGVISQGAEGGRGFTQGPSFVVPSGHSQGGGGADRGGGGLRDSSRGRGGGGGAGRGADH